VTTREQHCKTFRCFFVTEANVRVQVLASLTTLHASITTDVLANLTNARLCAAEIERGICAVQAHWRACRGSTGSRRIQRSRASGGNTRSYSCLCVYACVCVCVCVCVFVFMCLRTYYPCSIMLFWPNRRRFLSADLFMQAMAEFVLSYHCFPLYRRHWDAMPQAVWRG
jgi:hypothetical protein